MLEPLRPDGLNRVVVTCTSPTMQVVRAASRSVLSALFALGCASQPASSSIVAGPTPAPATAPTEPPLTAEEQAACAPLWAEARLGQVPTASVAMAVVALCRGARRRLPGLRV